jgi:hypothetical protein
MPFFGQGMQFGSGGDATYAISKSCMFNGTDDAMSRTPGSAGNQRTFSQSMWVKRSAISTSGAIAVGVGATGTGHTVGMFFGSDDTLSAYIYYTGSAWAGQLTSTKTFRDPTAWYHIVLVVDTTEGAASVRIKMWVNGSQIQDLSTAAYPDQNQDLLFNSAVNHEINSATVSGGSRGNFFNGYIAELHYIDGTAIGPTAFAETNDEGVWVPKRFSGSYGTTGFYLDFKESADLGDDESGQGNDWTESNIAVANQSTDTPTNNHCTWNPAFPNDSNITLSEGARNFSHSGGDQRSTVGTMFPRTGKWYWEVKVASLGGSSPAGLVGIGQADVISQFDPGDSRHEKTGTSLGYRLSDGQTYFGDSTASFGNSFALNDIWQCAWDADNGKVWFGKNNTWQNSGDPTSGATGTGAFGTTLTSTVQNGGGWGPTASNESSDVYEARFAEAEWSYSAPTGFKAFCTENLPEPTIKDGSAYFQMDDYAGTGSSNARTFAGNSDMQPDFLWIKAKNTTTSWTAFNAATGVQKYTQLNNRDNLVTDANSLTAFGSDGFTVGSAGIVNDGSYTFFAAGWSAGNSGSSNTDGSINTASTYADQTAGMSVGTYTGTGNVATVGHGLGATPDFVVVFSQSYGDHKIGVNWQAKVTQFSERIVWDKVDDAFAASTNCITAGSSTTFTIGTERGINENTETFQYYAFREIEGFSKFGTYTGTANANGPYLYCGFSPAMIIMKADAGGEAWTMFNAKTDAYNPRINYARMNENNAFTTGSTIQVDFLSNGVKLRGTDGIINKDGYAIIYMAFAENPFGGEEVAPATAE